MSIRDETKYLSSFWNWEFLRGCFGGAPVEVSDIDGCIEKRSHLLLIETKSPGEEPPNGQKFMWENLRRTGRIKILVIWGQPGEPEQALYISEKSHEWYPQASIETIQKIVSEWYAWAAKQPISYKWSTDTIDWLRYKRGKP